MHQDIERERKLTKHEARKWLKTAQFEWAPDAAVPSIASPVPESEAVKNALLGLMKSKVARRVDGLSITLSPDNKIIFAGEPTLMYLVAHDIKFPGSEDYERRYALGKELLEAADDNDDERVAGLLAQSAYPNVLNKHKDSALHHAARHQNFNMAERLLNAKANPNMPNDDLTTPLHFAGERVDPKDKHTMPSLQMIDLLCEHGADPNRQNDAKQSPLDEAKGRHQVNLESRLKQHAQQQTTWAENLGPRTGVTVEKK